jgi:hypothetical protein
MNEYLVNAGKFIKQWMAEHPDCNDLAYMYSERNKGDRIFLSRVLVGIQPWKYMSFIPDWAFYNCEELTNVELSHNVLLIGEKAFMRCKNLESITLGDGVVSIESEAFRGCKKLKKIIIPNGVSVLRYSPFYECESLTDVTLGTGIQYLGEYTFYGCEKLSNIKYKGTMKQFNEIKKEDNWHELIDPLGPGAFIYIKTVQCSDGVIDL